MIVTRCFGCRAEGVDLVGQVDAVVLVVGADAAVVRASADRLALEGRDPIARRDREARMSRLVTEDPVLNKAMRNDRQEKVNRRLSDSR